jgi:catechol 2,3-dioxygenase-like lactoylglutathione lyase family enzyme
MSSTLMSDAQATQSRRAGTIDMKLEVVVIPVSDVDRAKRFYGSLGWRLDGDFVKGDAFRGVQFTPPDSSCSIHFGRGITPAVPGSAQGLFLVVSDIEAAHADLVARGVDVSEAFHRAVGEAPGSGADPERRSYASYATFRDPPRGGRARRAREADRRQARHKLARLVRRIHRCGAGWEGAALVSSSHLWAK